MHGPNTRVVAFMSRKSITTHLREGSQLEEDYSKFVEVHGFETDSEAMRHLIGKGVRPYSRFQIYWEVLGASWLAMLLLAAVSIYMSITYQSQIWGQLAQTATMAAIMGACLIIAGGGLIIYKRARFSGTGLWRELQQLLPGGESA
jgi:hypothetical protein